MKKIFTLTLISCFLFLGKANGQVMDFRIGPGGGGIGAFPIVPIIAPPEYQAVGFTPLSNYHFFNPYNFNPAMAGINGGKQLNFNWNRQMDHHFSLSYEQAIPSINSGFGIFARYQSSEFLTMINYGTAFNYGFQLDENSEFRIGLQISQIHLSADLGQFGFDPSLSDDWWSLPSVDIGFALKYKEFKMGLSWQNVFPSNVSKDYGALGSIEVENDVQKINFSVANTYELSKKLDLGAASIFRLTFGEDAINDYSVYLFFKKRVSFGMTYRTGVENKYIGFMGFKIKDKLNLQYSFNFKKEKRDPRFFEVLTQYQF